MDSMASDGKKSSQTVKNCALALLALWSIIALVVIVVWATSPDLKGSAKCRAELQNVTKSLEDTKVALDRKKVELEEQRNTEGQRQEQQTAEFSRLWEHLNATNSTLEECRQEQVRICSVIGWVK